MLQRTKYSRLRNDSLSSLDDRLQDTKGDPQAPAAPLAPLHAQEAHARAPDGESSTLRGFIPRMAGISLLGGLGALTHKSGHRNIDRRADERPVSDADWTSGQASRCHAGGTKGPIALQGCPLHPLQGGLCRLKIVPPEEEGPENSVVHHHHVEYMGSLEVTQSMRTLDFDTRMQITREAISRLCEASPGVKSAIRSKRSLPKAVSVVLGQSNLQFSGSSVILTVSTESMSLTTVCPLQTVAHHSIQAISFASGGDPDLADFIAYVAKDPSNRRLCYIVKCPAGRACKIISSIDQAFQARFRQLLRQNAFILPTTQRCLIEIIDRIPERCFRDNEITEFNERSEESDYYNQIPGKVPPSGGIQDLRISREADQQDGLIQEMQVCSSKPISLYENCCIAHGPAAPSTVDRSVCEASMEPMEQPDSGPEWRPLSQDLIEEEGWFHGRLGRKQAEALLSCSGDFLVRESCSASGQYVLSGMEGQTVKHLLLVHPNGQVRTCDQVFQSVGHLVRFHMGSRTPIASGCSELNLTQPILHTY
ncbi:SHC-transforming protein 1-like isoform X1 [Gadus macrocephalus]|uniref:SHC-transforming protein 1-like isoform X1 n=1 Tax=Gadus macrocephalus TaxID=80720 RepID=UPI0028CB1B68|nr:SHC-transforming protein 1-like isoform X1 [Gadus macrocephalus]